MLLRDSYIIIWASTKQLYNFAYSVTKVAFKVYEAVEALLSLVIKKYHLFIVVLVRLGIMDREFFQGLLVLHPA